MKSSVCCFSGYRPEKMPDDFSEHSLAFQQLQQQLHQAIISAIQDGYRHFLCGMSRGFDLWAAETVIQLINQGYNIDLWAAIAFPNMHQQWEPHWRKRYQTILQHTHHVFSACDRYTPECYHIRDRFLVEQSSRCICFFDGLPGGTQYTIQYAKRRGLYIDNLADPQLSFF